MMQMMKGILISMGLGAGCVGGIVLLVTGYYWVGSYVFLVTVLGNLAWFRLKVERL